MALRGSNFSLIAKAGAFYFALIFGAGFLFGIIRTLWIAPFLGARRAEMAEMPLMLIAIVFAARWTRTRFLRSAGAWGNAAAGLVALTFLLIAEVGVGVLLRGMSVAEVFLNRDAVAGPIYYALLAFYAALPWWLARGRRSASSSRERRPND